MHWEQRLLHRVCSLGTRSTHSIPRYRTNQIRDQICLPLRVFRHHGALLWSHLVCPKRFLWTIISIQFVVDLGTVIVSFSQCQPIYEFWGPNTKEHCWDPKVQQYTGYFQGCKMRLSQISWVSGLIISSCVLFCGSDPGWVPSKFVLEPKHEAVDEAVAFSAYGPRRVVGVDLRQDPVWR
jgi:hypothetical protein